MDSHPPVAVGIRWPAVTDGYIGFFQLCLANGQLDEPEVVNLFSAGLHGLLASYNSRNNSISKTNPAILLQ